MESFYEKATDWLLVAIAVMLMARVVMHIIRIFI